MKIKNVIYIIALLLMFALGYYIASITKKNDVEIKTVKVTETKYIKVPVTTQEAFDCVQSPIRIQTQAEGNTIIITANDDCKEAQAFIKTECNNKKESKALSAGIGFLVGVALFLLL
jgi:hypothetical protein